ncbi:MAG TPA: MFS transporter [Dongiaceae bacterium]|jgi:MFS family permease|nr:MFS transporter [Dongiaceae bacterium]
MWNAIRPALPVLVAIALIEAGLGLLNPVIGIQLNLRGVNALLIGIISSAYSVGFLLGSLTTHRVIDRVGHIRALCVFAALTADAIALHVVFHAPLVWLALRIVQGYALAGAYLVIESWMNDKASAESRSRLFSVYTATSWAVSGLSPLLFNVVDARGPTLFVIAAIFMATSLVSMGLTRVGNPEIAHRRHFGLIQLSRISPLGVACCFGAGFLNGGLYALLPVYTAARGLGPRELSVLISMSTAGALLGQLPVGYLADHYGRRPVIIATMFVSMAIALAIYSLPQASFGWVLGLFLLLNMVESPLYGLGVSQANDYIQKKDFVAASGGLLFAWGLGAAAGPGGMGYFMGRWGGEKLFLIMAIGFCAIACFAIYRILRRRAKSAREQGNYVAMPVVTTQGAGTSAATELDPRS